MYYDDYYEPTLAEEIFDEAKEKLETAIKNEIKDKIQTAEKLLAEQDKKETELRAKENKLNWRERELESKFNNLENNLEKEFVKKKLGEFMAMLQKYLGQTYYQVDMYSELISKCNGCNDDRKIDIIMPDNSTTTINCSCNKRVYKYHVIEKEMIGIQIEKDGHQQKVWLNYYTNSDNAESMSPIYNVNEKFEDVKDKKLSYKLFYTNKEEAQKHADFLNEFKNNK